MSDGARPELPPLWTRLGLALIAPGRAFALADEADGRAGLGDAATLLFLKLLCLETRALVAAGWSAIEVGVMPALAGLGPRVQRAIGLDLIIIFVAGVFVTLAAGRRRRVSRDFDLAAVAWVPFYALSVAASLVTTALSLRPPRAVTDVLGLTALALTAGWLGLAVRHARRRPAPPAETAGAGAGEGPAR